jgi:hypothetical protein
MDVQSIGIGISVTAFCALFAMSFTKPDVYLEIIYPLVKVLNYMVGGATIGAVAALMIADSYLSPFLDNILDTKKVLAMSQVRNIPMYFFMVAFAYSIVDLALFHFASSVSARDRRIANESRQGSSAAP